MTKKKKIIIYIISIICTIIVGLGAFFGIRIYLNNRITFTINDTLADGQGKKARVILLAGQSNASGCSLSEYLEKNASEEKYAEYTSGYDNIYINYHISDSHLSQGFVKTTPGQGEFTTTFGPEIGIAEKLNELYPDEQIFIIKYALGNTALFEKWLSPSSEGKTGNLYRGFIKFVKTSMEYLESKNYDAKIEGMCWMQGESDSFTVENGNNYKTHLSNFIKDMRKQLRKYAADDGIAFVDATIADNPMYWVYCDLVNDSKKAVAEMSPMNVLIDTNAAGLITSNEPEDQPDIPHYDSMSEIKLGNMFAEQLALFF